MSCLNTLNEILSDVIAGSEEAEKELDLVPIKVDIKEPRITQMDLQLSKKQNSEIAAAAKALKLPLLEECAKANVNYASFIYKTITKTDLKADVVEPQDYAQTIKALLKEIHEGIGIGAFGPQQDDPPEDDPQEDDLQEDDKEDNVAVVSSKGDVGGGHSVVSAGDSGGDVGGGHSVVVSAGDSGDHVGGGQSVVVSAGNSGGDAGGGDGVVSAGDSGGEVGNAVGVALSKGGTGGEVRSGDGIAVSAGGSEEDGHFPPQYKDSKSKNKRRRCPYCDFFGPHLDRHLASMHQEKVLTKQERKRLVYRADAKDKKKRGVKTTSTNPFEHMYQCGIHGCQKIVSRMSQHLRRNHKMTDPSKIEEALKKFVRLSGQRTRRLTTNPKAEPEPGKTPVTKASKATKRASETSTGTPPKQKRRRIKEKEEEEEEVDDTSSEDGSYSVHDDSDDEISEESGDEQDKCGCSSSEHKRWKEFYLDAPQRDKTVRGHFVSTFYRYLLHVEGGAHSEEQAMIHTRQVHRIFDVLDPDGDDLDCLIRKDSMDIWDLFAGPRLRNKELKGNTLKVYLRSLEYFAKFIKKNIFYNKDLLTADQRSAIIDLRERLPDYRSTIHRRTATETTTRKVEEAYKKITPEDIRAFQSSEVCKKAVKLMGDAISLRKLTKKEFVTVRDFLLVTTLYENGSRPGPFENAKVDRFERAVYTASKKRWTVLVDEHKTTRHQGPAELTMDEQLYGYIKLYVQHIRPDFVKPGVDYLFLKDDGYGFRKGTVGRRVPEVFKAAGVRTDIRVSATNIRKLYSSSAQEMSPKKKRLINAHMKHKESTADTNYVIKVNTDRSTKAHELMQHVIAGKEQDDIDSEVWEPKEVTTKSQSEDDEADDEAKTPEEKAGNDSCHEPPAPVLEKVPETEEVKLSDDDKVVLLCVFDDNIRRGQVLTREEVKALLRTDNHLKGMLINPEKVKKACDFLRYKTNTVRQTQMTADPYDEYEFNPGLTHSSASGLRRQWDPAFSAVIEDRMESIAKKPRRREVIQFFDNDKVLRHVLAREGAERCHEKVKNIFKKRSKE